MTIGPSDIASVEYLTENDLALSASNESQLSEIVRKINEDHSILNRYATKGRSYSTVKLNASQMRQTLYDDLQHVIDKYKNR